MPVVRGMSKDRGNSIIATPIQTIGTILRVIRGLYLFKAPTTQNAVAEKIRMNSTEVRKTFSDARELGFVKSGEEPGTFALTPSGEEMVLLLEHGKEEAAKSCLAKQILHCTEWSEIMSFVKSKSQQAWDINDLVILVERKQSTRWGKNRRKKAAAAYRSILKYAGLVKSDGHMLVSNPISGSQGTSSETKSAATAKPKADKNVDFTETPFEMDSAADYFGFVVPEKFMIFIRKTEEAILDFRQNLAVDSFLCSWLENLEVGNPTKGEGNH